jgi:hypothetical protein
MFDHWFFALALGFAAFVLGPIVTHFYGKWRAIVHRWVL